MDSYNQGSQDPGGGYQPMEPMYGPPPQKKGFNWLACCGISCGVILIGTIIFFVFVGNFVNKIAGGAMKVAMELESTDAATIRAQAQSEDATVVAGNPSGYTSQWVAMSCTVMSPEEFGRTYFGGGSSDDWSSSDFQNQSGQQGTMYLVEGGFMVIDSSNAPTKAQPGDQIIAYGKPFVMDFTAIPGVGSEMPQELQNLKMFMAKEIDVVAATGGDEAAQDAPPGGEETGSCETWGK